ncbi:MAG: AAA family ATPase [Bacteroidia bacterium]
METFKNPFRPGAGQLPPYLSGRKDEQDEFRLMLDQSPVLKNLIITGLRGVGKTVLLETLKPLAVEKGWFWAGTDLSESASVSEQSLAIRILADLSGLVSSFTIGHEEQKTVGYIQNVQSKEIKLSYEILVKIYSESPGLDSDKLKVVLEFVWNAIKTKAKGVVLAYDEAQILQDKASDKQFPLSVLLEVIQYLQRKGIPYFLILTGLPTLFPNLVEARTYAERMFHIMTLDKLTESESREAILKPITQDSCPVSFSEEAIVSLMKFSGGYPYFIQFFCKEAFDSYLQQKAVGVETPAVTINEVVRKLDSDFYSGRWSRITERQRDVLEIIATLPSANEEFSAHDILAKATTSVAEKLSSSHLNQILKKLIASGFIYKNKHGKYSFAVPMLADYINRQKKN